MEVSPTVLAHDQHLFCLRLAWVVGLNYDFEVVGLVLTSEDPNYELEGEW